jgi:hypothetical protein
MITDGEKQLGRVKIDGVLGSNKKKQFLDLLITQ